MKQFFPFHNLAKFETGLWLTSITVIIASFLCSGGNWPTLAASLIGVTALIFVAKGYVSGQILTVVFAVFYGVISFFFRYYGEMITYLCMTAPMAVVTATPFRAPKRWRSTASADTRFFWWQSLLW